MPKYNPLKAEAKWQKTWAETKLYQVDLNDDSKPKYFNVAMFPYPSGDKLHIGHWYNYGPSDSWGRYKKLLGFNVFEPMGFDSFGLPAENYAIKTGVLPQDSIAVNTTKMTEQLSKIGAMFDWSKTLKTSDPDYYHWTQWIFSELYKNGLAYQKEAYVNWDPIDQTVLANEQVLADGTAERSGAKVEQKLLKQWFFGISKYSQKLLDGMKDLDWPEKTIHMQENWIGRSQGALVKFKVDASVDSNTDAEIEVYTTRPDTIFGVSYLVLAPEHPLIEKILTEEQKAQFLEYKASVAAKSELQRTDLAKDKSGVFSGAYATNPINGKKIPIWIADYVLMTYGTGAIMAVPAHDQRDLEFAEKYNLEVIQVIDEENTLINSDFLNGLNSEQAKIKVCEWLKAQNLGDEKINYRLRDWLISRQRYWGAPIPIVYDPEGKAHLIPEEHLPWQLPTDINFKPTGTSPLAESKELLERTEKIFGKGWKPEFDTMDTFVCSSFYYLRYLMGENAEASKKFVHQELADKWLPIDMYVGGPEHACMHLIYARFIMNVLHDLGYVSEKEPFKKLFHQGLITYQGSKMSKSKGNVISPDGYVERYGSDVFRMYLMFMGPYSEGGDWNDTGINGIVRFTERFYNLVLNDNEVSDVEEMQKVINICIKKVSEDIEKLQFNTCIAAMMEFVNQRFNKGLDLESKAKMIVLLAPFAPHLAEELWSLIGNEYSVFNQSWPKYEEKYLIANVLNLAVQVNGKLRAEIEVPANFEDAEILAAAKADSNVQKYLAEGNLVKEIYVKGKLVSLVIK